MPSSRSLMLAGHVTMDNAGFVAGFKRLGNLLRYGERFLDPGCVLAAFALRASVLRRARERALGLRPNLRGSTHGAQHGERERIVEVRPMLACQYRSPSATNDRARGKENALVDLLLTNPALTDHVVQISDNFLNALDHGPPSTLLRMSLILVANPCFRAHWWRFCSARRSIGAATPESRLASAWVALIFRCVSSPRRS